MQRLILLVLCVRAATAQDTEPQEKPTLPPSLNATRDGFNFYRSMRVVSPGKSGRRVFGGNANDITDFPYACALLDVYYNPSCSCSVLRPHWGLTAAHCLSTSATYVKYNTHVTKRNSGDIAVVQFHFRHPRYKVEYKDDGNGADVAVLHHDVGLLRTKEPMKLIYAPAQVRFLTEMLRYNPVDIRDHVVRAYGFGVATETEATQNGPGIGGERLMSVDLRMIFCDRPGWYHCVCGTADSEANGRGVCSGDSGGPVLYRGSQVAVTSMGPIKCSSNNAGGVVAGTTSVFTALYNYVDVINATIIDKEQELVNLKPLSLRSHASEVSPSVTLSLLARVLAYTVLYTLDICGVN